LASLSDEVALALSKHQGILSLRGLVTISDAALATLAKHRGELRLSDTAESAIDKYR
jgi:hypothetical protein